MIELYAPPEEYPHYTFPNYPGVRAHGHRALAEFLISFGDIHVNEDDGYAKSNYITDRWAVRQEVLILGGKPERYRCLTS